MEAMGDNDKLKPYKGRKVRCNECNGCLAQDCLKCKYCIDKYEGPKKLKKACILKNCLYPCVQSPMKKMRQSKVPKPGSSSSKASINGSSSHLSSLN